MTNNKVDEALENELPFTPNPLYGKGVFRRRIRLRKETPATPTDALKGEQLVVAEIEDDNHGFRVKLYHDEKVVTHVEGEALRYPLSTCPGSLDLLKDLVGSPLTSDPRSLSARVDPRQFCTHQFDLASFAITHALRDDVECQYDAVIQDQQVKKSDDGVDGALVGWNQVTVSINGDTVYDWQLKDFEIQTEGPWQGKSILHGFPKWASENLSEQNLEAALILARCVFVSNSRRFEVDEMAGEKAFAEFMPKDVCYTYRSERVQEAIYTQGTVRDFTHKPEYLLQYKEFDGKSYYK